MTDQIDATKINAFLVAATEYCKAQTEMTRLQSLELMAKNSKKSLKGSLNEWPMPDFGTKTGNIGKPW